MCGENGIAGINGMGKPYVTAYYAVVTNLSISSENCGTCVNDYIVADVGMTLDTFYEGSVGINCEALRTECNALIKLYMFADCSRPGVWDGQGCLPEAVGLRGSVPQA